MACGACQRAAVFAVITHLTRRRRIAALPPDVRKGSRLSDSCPEIHGGCAARTRGVASQKLGKSHTVSRRLTAHQAAEPQHTSTA